jgi:hypothetical protein
MRILERGLDFWIGSETFPTAARPATPYDLDQQKLEAHIEELAGEGCIAVNNLLYALQRNEVPEKLAGLSRLNESSSTKNSNRSSKQGDTH